MIVSFAEASRLAAAGDRLILIVKANGLAGALAAPAVAGFASAGAIAGAAFLGAGCVGMGEAAAAGVAAGCVQAIIATASVTTADIALHLCPIPFTFTADPDRPSIRAGYPTIGRKRIVDHPAVASDGIIESESPVTTPTEAATMTAPEMKSFRESRWRYSQFFILGLLLAGLVKWLSPLGWLVSLGIGAALGVAYFLFERKRGVI